MLINLRGLKGLSFAIVLIKTVAQYSSVFQMMTKMTILLDGVMSHTMPVCISVVFLSIDINAKGKCLTFKWSRGEGAPNFSPPLDYFDPNFFLLNNSETLLHNCSSIMNKYFDTN